MERKNYGLNRFKWPRKPDIELYEQSDLLLNISEVSPVEDASNEDVVWCVLAENDFNDANTLLTRMLMED